MKSLHTIAIIGRPNVGKSTLFNKLLGRREAIVLNRPGVTRDRHYGRIEFNNREFFLIDTGGFVQYPDDAILENVNKQVEIAIEEADLIWFLVDQKSGHIPGDETILKKIRASGKPFKILCNKCDNENITISPDFYSLGGDITQISALNGNGVEGLLLDLEKLFRGDPHALRAGDDVRLRAGDDARLRAGDDVRLRAGDDVRLRAGDDVRLRAGDDAGFKIAIVGRPNVGKSSIVNALLGKERMLVDSRPGTTRDSVDSFIKAHGENIVLIDTAGIRRHGKREDTLESLVVILVEKRLINADLAWLVIDISEGITDQDKRVAHIIEERGIPLIVIANKWDLVPKENRETTSKNLPKAWKGAIPSLAKAPIVTASAKNNLRVHELLRLSVKVKHEAPKMFTTDELKNWLETTLTKHPPPKVKNRPIVFRKIKQLRNIPPTFLFSVNRPNEVPLTYRRYIAASLKNRFKFGSYPIKTLFR